MHITLNGSSVKHYLHLSVQNDIRKNPTFRSQFHEMCAKVGVDPLASNKGFWAELLGIGDFYYELGLLRLLHLNRICVTSLHIYFG